MAEIRSFVKPQSQIIFGSYFLKYAKPPKLASSLGENAYGTSPLDSNVVLWNPCTRARTGVKAMERTFNELTSILTAQRPARVRYSALALRLAESLATGVANGVGIAVGRVLAG
ncbi:MULTISPECIES: hypothetical protein [unclassified Mesorhizobium]|uniref:hypothetical protein n=1 Tax=unclassified Mesorhizobium TaxID=325217 RepID=UPI002414F5C7|nr:MULTISPECIES: hypothetical protein [unclassified Mesorhizobium]MDG4854081.1 hypothetical protein [Mesorhizobium sp. WSM4982]MDG4910903.1 hypothetical protein [Mesorhizobium sp. WSM4983]